ncbi:MAG TPA: hypothetical protein VF532_11640 [Candidatus Angelobacter sp.]
MTGVATAAVQVAVTCDVGEAERWTEGSLAVQFEGTRAAVIAGHPLWTANWNEALKISLLPGAAATWSAVLEEGVTFKPTAPQSLLEPPQPAMKTRLLMYRAHKSSLDMNIANPSFLLHNSTMVK